MSVKLPFEEWDQISLEAYKEMLNEVRLGFEAAISETISVTDKTTKFLIGFLTFLFATSALVFMKYPLSTTTWLIYCASAANSFFGAWIIRARLGYSSGLHIENIATKDFDNIDFTLAEKEQLVYFNLIKAYKLKVDGIIDDNNERSKSYNLFMFCTIGLVLAIALSALLTISDHRMTALF